MYTGNASKRFSTDDYTFCRTHLHPRCLTLRQWHRLSPSRLHEQQGPGELSSLRKRSLLLDMHLQSDGNASMLVASDEPSVENLKEMLYHLEHFQEFLKILIQDNTLGNPWKWSR